MSADQKFPRPTFPVGYLAETVDGIKRWNGTEFVSAPEFDGRVVRLAGYSSPPASAAHGITGPEHTHAYGTPGETLQEGERPVSIGCQVPVTDEMIAAGKQAHRDHNHGNVIAHHLPEAIYRAMHAAAPVEFCPEDRIAALERERDAWQDRCGNSEVQLKRSDEIIAALRTELIAARDTISATMAQRIDWYDAQLAARDARIAELDTRLAAFTATNVPDPPKPAHDFTRDFAGDRRMIGR